jgi:hypothetical protein
VRKAFIDGMEKDIREILKAEAQETQVSVVTRLTACDTATSLAKSTRLFLVFASI